MTITTDLIDDIENILDFLAYTKEGVIMTCLISTEKIVAELREAATQLTKGLHFPFKIQLENWCYTEICKNKRVLLPTRHLHHFHISNNIVPDV